MIQQEEKADNSWRWVRISAAVLLVIIAVGIITISAGYFDPKPIGDLQKTYQLTPLSVDARSSLTHWLNEPSVAGPGTFRLKAGFDHGEVDSSYGLAIGSNQDRVIVALSPAGYLTIQRWSDNNGQTTEIDQILPWQTWPHIRPQNSENEIWVDIEGDFLTSIRINQELLWQEKVPLRGHQIGLTAQSFGEPASFNFFSLQLYRHQE
jgi:hypothetical protein